MKVWLLRILEVPEITASALLLCNCQATYRTLRVPNPATYFLTARSGYSLRFEKRLNPNIHLGPPALRVLYCFYTVIDRELYMFTSLGRLRLDLPPRLLVDMSASDPLAFVLDKS